GGHGGGQTAGHGNHGDLAANQLGRQFRQPLGSTFGPAVNDGDVLALHVTAFLEALVKSAQTVCGGPRRPGIEISDDRQLRLLRARCEWPRRCTAKQCDELAPPHSITSSASVSRLSEILRPSALAVVRLMTRSDLVGCSIGSSPGFAPRKILST